jgi:hypothetical protein
MPLKSCQNPPNRGPKSHPSRQKPIRPPMQRLIDKYVTTYWVRFFRPFLHSAICILQSPGVPAGTQDAGDLAGRLPLADEERFGEQPLLLRSHRRSSLENAERSAGSRARRTQRILYHKFSDMSSRADKIIMPCSRREGPSPQRRQPPAGMEEAAEQKPPRGVPHWTREQLQ